MRNLGIAAVVVLALASTGCQTAAGLFSSGSRSVIFLDPAGQVVRDKDGKVVVGTIDWKAENIYADNLKTIVNPKAGPEGAGADKVDHWPLPEPKALSLILAGACALLAGLAVYLKRPGLALPFVGAGAFIAAVPYAMPKLVDSPLVPILAVGGALLAAGILVWREIERSRGAAANDAARDETLLDSAAKAVCEGDLAAAIRDWRNYDPAFAAKVAAKKAAGVRAPAPPPRVGTGLLNC